VSDTVEAASTEEERSPASVEAVCRVDEERSQTRAQAARDSLEQSPPHATHARGGDVEWRADVDDVDSRRASAPQGTQYQPRADYQELSGVRERRPWAATRGDSRGR
jgi:hypothetical protein